MPLTDGTNRMALNVTSPSAVKWTEASGSEESYVNTRDAKHTFQAKGDNCGTKKITHNHYLGKGLVKFVVFLLLDLLGANGEG